MCDGPLTFWQDERFPGVSRRENPTGSSSLLSSSDVDGSASPHRPWGAEDDSPDFPANVSRRGTSTERRQSSISFTPHGYSDSTHTDSVFTFNQNTPLPGRAPLSTTLDPSSREFRVSDVVWNNSNQYSRNNSEGDDAYNSRRGFGSGDSAVVGLADRSLGYNNISREGSLPPPPGRGEFSNLQNSRYGPNVSVQRTNASANTGPNLMRSEQTSQRLKREHSAPRLETITGHLNRLTVQDRRPSYASSQHSPNSTTDSFAPVRAATFGGASNNQWGNEDQYPSTGSLSPSTGASGFARQNQVRGPSDGQYSQSPADSDTRFSHQSPFYSQTGTPPTINQHTVMNRVTNAKASIPQPAVLNERLRGVQQAQQGYTSQQGSMALRHQMNFPFEIGAQQSFPMNPLAPYYPMPPPSHILAGPQAPRGPAHDHDTTSPHGSPLLEDFKHNSKTNKRYDLKVDNTILNNL